MAEGLVRVEAGNTETGEVCAVYEITGKRGHYYTLRLTDPHSPSYEKSIGIHISALAGLSDAFRALAEKEGKY